MAVQLNSPAMQTHADGFAAAMRDRSITYTCDPDPSMRKPHPSDARHGNVDESLTKTFQHYFNDDDTAVKITRYWLNGEAVGIRVGGLTAYENMTILRWLIGHGPKPKNIHDDL